MKREVEWLLKEKYKGKPGPQFDKDIKRLQKGEPLDYVIGFTEFLGCRIDLLKRPLIPRPETEFWVKEAISKIYPDFKSFKNKDIRVLDIFAGSGCIGIAMLRNLKGVNVAFAEKDESFLKQIKINCEINNINKKRYTVIQSDVFKNIEVGFDYIFANPPYIPTIRKDKIQKPVLKHEPKQALFGGKDGLFYIKKFLSQAKDCLNPGGQIFMEFDSIQKKQIEKLLKEYNYKNWEFKKDQYGKWRWAHLKA